MTKLKNIQNIIKSKLCHPFFRNANPKDMKIQKRTVHEHFSDKKKAVGRGKFLKKCVDDM